jgi:Putative peptidoglycan binding domain
MLLAGDLLRIPAKIAKSVAVETGARHRFRRLGVPAKFRIQLFLNDQPRAGQEYRLEVDGAVLSSGTTDADGVLEEAIPPQAKQGRLVVGPDQEEIPLDFGYLDPSTEDSGVAQRLRNLGFYPEAFASGPEDDLGLAIVTFQATFGLPASGEADPATRRKLEEIHDQKSQLPAAAVNLPAELATSLVYD